MLRMRTGQVNTIEPAIAPKRIGILGAFGTGNTGNEGTLEAAVAMVREICPRGEVLCICPFPDKVRADYDITTLPLHASPKHFRTFSRLLFNVPGAVVDVIETARRAAELDVLIIPGTGVLDDYCTGPTGSPYEIFKWCAAAKLKSLPIVFLSVGAGPISHPMSRILLKNAAKLATYRSFRDPGSKQFMGSLGLDTNSDEVFPDLTFSLPTELDRGGVADDGTIGVGVMAYKGWRSTDAGIYQSYLGKIGAFTVWLLDQGHRVRLLMGDAVDQAAIDDLLRNLAASRPNIPPGSIEFEPAHSLSDVLRQVSRTSAVVATRFHNLVAALKMGKPAISIGYSQKNDALLESAGLGAFCQSIESLDLSLLKEQFTELMSKRSAYVDGIFDAKRAINHDLARQQSELSALLGRLTYRGT